MKTFILVLVAQLALAGHALALNETPSLRNLEAAAGYTREICSSKDNYCPRSRICVYERKRNCDYEPCPKRPTRCITKEQWKNNY
jgi:hypothetical protein